MNWLETGEDSPLPQSNSMSHKEKEKIEAAFESKINKFQFQTSSMINPELLAAILEEVIELKNKYKLSEKSVQIFLQIYILKL